MREMKESAKTQLLANQTKYGPFFRQPEHNNKDKSVVQSKVIVTEYLCTTNMYLTFLD